MNRLQMKRQQDPAFFPSVQIMPAITDEGKLLIGDVHSLNLEILQRENVKAIVSCSKECDCRSKLGEYAKEVRIFQINIRDTPADNIGKYFDDAFSFIQRGRKEGAVLVQCMAGISRSSAIILAYMMRRLGVSLDNALTYLKQKRPKINPNEGFMNQLRLYEKDLGVANSKKQIDLDEMKENISTNTGRPKFSRQITVSVSKETSSEPAVKVKAPIEKENQPQKQQPQYKLQHKRSRSFEQEPDNTPVRNQPRKHT